jgi:hypothetical protein
VLENPDRDAVADLEHIKEKLYCSTPCEPCSRFLKMMYEFGAFPSAKSTTAEIVKSEFLADLLDA